MNKPETRVDKQLNGLNRHEARLVFDSADLEKRPGVRGAEALDRHQMFRAEPYSLNLRIERNHRSGTAVLVGQITAIAGYARRIGELPVDLAADGETIAQTSTSPLGEFQLEYEPRASMRLQLRVPDQSFIELPVDMDITRHIDDVRADPYELADWVWNR